jgi:hypothetical protein
VEDHLFQLRRDRRVRGTTDRRLEYAVGDLRDNRQQRVDGSQRHPARSECVHVVLLYGSDANTRAACELHTLNLWQSHADPDGHSHGDSHADSNTNCYSNSYAYTDGHAYCYSNSYAYTDGYAYCDSYCHAYARTYAYRNS